MAKGPPPTTAACVAGILAAVVAAGTALVLIGSLTPIFMLTPRDPEDRAPLAALLLVVGLVAYLVYRTGVRIAARVFIARGKRFEVPSTLIVACLATSDYPCPRCAYNLRGLQQPACPECNEPVRLALVDYHNRTPGDGFGLALGWLLVTTVCTLLVSAYAVKLVIQLYAMMSTMGGGVAMGGGSAFSYVLWYAIYGLVPTASFIVCLARLYFLLFAKGEKATRWTRSTVLALSIVNVGWMLLFGLLAAIGLLQ